MSEGITLMEHEGLERYRQQQAARRGRERRKLEEAKAPGDAKNWRVVPTPPPPDPDSLNGLVNYFREKVSAAGAQLPVDFAAGTRSQVGSVLRGLLNPQPTNRQTKITPEYLRKMIDVYVIRENIPGLKQKAIWRFRDQAVGLQRDIENKGFANTADSFKDWDEPTVSEEERRAFNESWRDKL